MDENKLQVLKDCNYIIMFCCAICKHGVFKNPHSDFGTCAIKTYDHKKHTEPVRQLSVYRYGRCEDCDFELDQNKYQNLGEWKQFV